MTKCGLAIIPFLSLPFALTRLKGCSPVCEGVCRASRARVWLDGGSCGTDTAHTSQGGPAGVSWTSRQGSLDGVGEKLSQVAQTKR